MGLYECLLEEREEGRRRGRPLGASYGSDSPILDRRLRMPLKDRPPGYRGDLRLLHRYINEGVRAQGAAMRFASLKNKYPKEHAELRPRPKGRESFRRVGAS